MSDFTKTEFGHLSDREILIVVATQSNTMQERLNDHGRRIRILEGVAKTASGAAAVIGIVITWFKFKTKIE